jgi:CubicO group peptidase (beta-lactamase class C family)
MMKSAYLILLLISITLYCTSHDSKMPGDDQFDFSEIDFLISAAIKDSAFPGAVVLIGNDKEIIYKKGYGNFTYDSTSTKVIDKTIYDIASLTKVIATTTAVMICVDKNLLMPDNPVSKYIPEFAQNDKEKITIKNLLLHNSGLPSWKKYYTSNLSAEEIINDIYNLKPEYQPGTKTLYSDLGFIVLGKLIEKVSGRTLDQFCYEEIFTPLEMQNTFFNPDDSLKYLIAPTEFDNYWRMKQIQGEVHDETASLLNGVAGHAGLFSSAEDIAKLLQMILNKGFYNGRQLIKSETIETFTKRYSDESSRALGWDTKSKTGSSAGNYFDESSFGHLGFTGTSVWIDPKRNLFVVFLTNRVYPSRENKKIFSIRPKLHDAVIKAIDEG